MRMTVDASERNLVIQIARCSATTAATAAAAATAPIIVIGSRLAEIRAAAAAAPTAIADLTALAALTARIEHLQLAAEFLQHDFGGVALDTILFPFAGLQLTLDVNLHALLEILL